MPFCRKCGAEYSEGDLFCERCGADLRRSTTEKRVVEEAQKPTEKAVQDAIKYLEEKRIDEAQKFTKEEKKKGSSIIGIIGLVLIFSSVFLYYILFYNYNKEPQYLEQQRGLLNQFNQYTTVLNDDAKKLNSVTNSYPQQMQNKVYIQYVDEYSIQAAVYRQHLIEFRNFITKNEASLQALDINTIQRKGAIDNELAIIDKNARDMQRNLQNMKESQEQTMNLLKLLATLFL